MKKKKQKKELTEQIETTPVQKQSDTEVETASTERTEEPIEQISENSQNNTMQRSHLRKRLERQSKKTFFLTSFGIIILLTLIALFGQTLLINFSVLLSGSQNTQQNNNPEDQGIVYIAPPILDPLPEATNSASLRITGALATGTKAQIKLYVNGELADVTQTEKDDSFSFEGIRLKEGENEIKAIAVIKDNKSTDSNILNISYVKKAPELSIEEPQDGSSYSGENNTISIKGKTNPGLSVTVNDYLAITRSDGSYSYTIKLQNGENKIKVVASDEAGNKTTKEIKITYSP